MKKMKDSGIEWIGEIPAHWEIQKLKYQAEKFERGTSPDYTDEPITKVVNQATFSRGFFDKKNIRFSKKNPAISRGLLKKGDVLLASTGGGVLGKTHFFNENDTYVADSHVTIVRTTDTLFSKYLYYYFSINYDTFNMVMAEGSTNQTELQRDLLGGMPVPFPPIEEQKKISAYLDEKCGNIDTIISELKKQIEILADYKKSIITETVTKGLNKNVKMKDSGIEWVGEIPEHWDISKIKYNFIIISGATPKSEKMEYWNGKINWITPADFKTDDMYISNGKKSITKAGYDSCGTTLVPVNSIVFSKRAPIGNVVISSESLCTSQGCLSCVSKGHISVKYFYFTISVFTEQFDMYGAGTTFKEISTKDFSNFILPLPPIEEQKKIADYLDKKCTEINKIISEKKQQIKTMEEYKKSLIFECVTGKRKV